MRRWIVLFLLLFVSAAVVPIDAGQAARSRRSTPAANSAKALYDQALARERQLRAAKGSRGAPLSQLRAVIRDYEAIPRRFPRSGYADNALWNAANIAFDAHIRFGTRDDRDTAVRLLQFLVREYPASSLTKDAHARLRRISAASPKLTKETPKATTRAAAATKPPATPPPAATELANANIAVADDTAAPVASASRVQVTNIQRTVLPEVVRVTIELDAEVAYNEEQLRNPDRLFFDLRGTQFGPGLAEGALQFEDGDIAREIRLGNQPAGVTRVVIDTRDVARHSLFTLYNPYRLVVDLYRQPSLTRHAAPTAPTNVPTAAPPPATAAARGTSPAAPDAAPTASSASTAPAAPASAPAATGVVAEGRTAAAAGAPPGERERLPSTTAGPNAVTLPAPPESNSGGNYSLARQLGLGVSRIVIDAGHGGHDPGSLGQGIREAELVLDVALRLEKLLKAEGNIDVVMTRRTDVFVDLEERTRIANRHNADLFLSIHANSSRRRTAQGVETFFLNFATTSDAEEVAARENSAARGSMRQLPDIVKAITLNNKVDESRDLAETVQKHIVQRLRRTYSDLPDRGVKQAPLVVLIGASMPSVLAEIGFISTPEEGQRLKTSTYRQEIAEALRDAVLRYQRSLKAVVTQAQEQ